MAEVVSKGTMLPAKVVADIFNGVRGHSSVARLTPEDPIAFNGNEYFIFNLDSEASIVGENEAKVNGGGTVSSEIVRPYKFEYGMRVSDEFLYGTEEYQMGVLEQFALGASRKFARGLDIGSFHGLNPKSGQPSSAVGNNHFDSKVGTEITYDASNPDSNLAAAVTAVQGAGGEVTGMALSPAFATAMANLKVNGVPQFPEFRFGGNPEIFAGMRSDVNNTIVFGSSEDRAIVGDFANAFKWGYAKNIPLEVIPYGNPDNSNEGDLKNKNQVYLRAEAYIGWAILMPTAFARITASE